jgi:multimeric flavodoxin WrbA
MSQVLIINSSQRAKSNSSALSVQVALGAEEVGHQVETIEIGKLNLKPCRHCEACKKPGADFCVIKDDMKPLYPKLMAADILIFSSPVYWFHLCGQIKQFIDRIYALAALRDDQDRNPLSYKKIGAVLSFADAPLASGYMGIVRSFQEICEYTEAQWLGHVYVNHMEAGRAARDEAALERALEFGLKL